jgi:CDP-diglyceride synthetase
MSQFKNLSARVLVALVAIPIILWLTMLGGYFFFFLIAVISSLALYEFYGLAQLLAGLELGSRDGSAEENK